MVIKQNGRQTFEILGELVLHPKGNRAMQNECAHWHVSLWCIPFLRGEGSRRLPFARHLLRYGGGAVGRHSQGVNHYSGQPDLT